MNILNVLGVDFETQSSDAVTTNVTEIGAVLEEISWRDGQEGLPARKRLATFGTLVFDPGTYPPQTPEIVEITGITDEMLRSGEGVMTPHAAFSALAHMVEQADLCMAHNKIFDETVYNSQVRLLALNPPQREWLCSYQEIPYPKKFRCKQLSHLALDHGVAMDGRTLHRAVNDVELMFDLVLNNYHLRDLLEYSREPWVILRADILPPWKDGGKGKDQATGLGYAWETPRGTNQKYEKLWVKRVKKKEVEVEIRLAPFRVVVVG